MTEGISPTRLSAGCSKPGSGMAGFAPGRGNWQKIEVYPGRDQSWILTDDQIARRSGRGPDRNSRSILWGFWQYQRLNFYTLGHARTARMRFFICATERVRIIIALAIFFGSAFGLCCYSVSPPAKSGFQRGRRGPVTRPSFLSARTFLHVLLIHFSGPDCRESSGNPAAV